MFRNYDFEDLEDPDEILSQWLPKKDRRRNKPVQAHRKPKQTSESIFFSLASEHDENDEFIQSYNPSRHERQWILDSLGFFYQQKWFTDILRLVKGGKEASVYLCQAHPTTSQRYLAAKVYRPRLFRNLRNDHIYREGRTNLDADGNQIHDGGMIHAMRKRTEYGKQLLHSSWVEYEYQALCLFYPLGLDCPRPFARANNAILMEYIGDANFPAPPLASFQLKRNVASSLFDRVLYNMETMLAHNRIHADLSAYNILYWDGEIKIIDFPQIISPFENKNAFTIFERDVKRICEYFQRQGVRREPKELARELWKKHHLSDKLDIDPSLLDSENDEDNRYWENLYAD